MKKKIAFLLIISLCMPVWADCRGGTEVETENEHVFCISDFGMTWWAAVTWCQANKRTLATWEQACPGKPMGYGSRPCPLDKAVDAVGWVANTTGEDRAFTLSMGYTPNNGGTYRRYDTALRAICY